MKREILLVTSYCPIVDPKISFAKCKISCKDSLPNDHIFTISYVDFLSKLSSDPEYLANIVTIFTCGLSDTQRAALNEKGVEYTVVEDNND